MIDLKRKIIQIWWHMKSWKYPYIYKFKFNYKKTSFLINSPIEEFRIKGWGGEKEFVHYLIRNLKTDDIFYDIGASVGLVSILPALKITNGKVYSFEPDPGITERLLKNIKLNRLSNIMVLQVALGDKRGFVRLYSEGSDNNSPSIKSIQGFTKFIKVKLDSVDNLIASGKVDIPTSIKIDVEGAEGMVLKGMKGLLSSSQRPRNIFIEIHNDFLPKFGSSSKEILSLLKKYKYKPLKIIKRSNQDLYHFVNVSI